MTDKEKIIDILLEFYEEYQGNTPNRPMIPSIYASKIIDSLQEEPVSEDICNQCEAHNDKDKCDKLVFGHKCPIVTTSEDLEEASEEYTGKVLERTNMLIGNQPVGEEIEAAFKAGAQWQKEKDFILTWVDIRDILILNSKVQNDIFGEQLDDYKLCNEILRRFKQRKG